MRNYMAQIIMFLMVMPIYGCTDSEQERFGKVYFLAKEVGETHADTDNWEKTMEIVIPKIQSSKQLRAAESIIIRSTKKHRKLRKILVRRGVELSKKQGLVKILNEGLPCFDEELIRAYDKNQRLNCSQVQEIVKGTHLDKSCSLVLLEDRCEFIER